MIGSDQDTQRDLARYLSQKTENVGRPVLYGRITKILGNMIRATMSDARIGEECVLVDPQTHEELRAEIIGMDGDEVILAPGDTVEGLSTRSFVQRTGKPAMAPAGDSVLGRVIDPFGGALDGKSPITTFTPLMRNPPNAMNRKMVDTPFVTRIRAIDGVLTLGRGQRIGLFGSAGVGKSVLLSQIVKGALADVIVVALIGERGREVAEFVHHNLGEEGLRKACVIVSTADRPATERLRAGYAATAVAESFREKGLSVLLIIDSATRIARATREIGLAAGEVPVRRGFPPSTFAALPRLLERAGADAHGTITAIYTVLVEGDNDDADPVADEMRSLLDGHIILSRKLASQGHYPAIDVTRSKSRVMDAIVPSEQSDAARKLNAHLTKLDEIELLLQVGEYRSGSDTMADAALEAREDILAFLRQQTGNFTDYHECLENLIGAVG